MINLLALTTPTTQTWVTLGVVAGIFAGSALLIGALILVIGKVFKVDMDKKVTKKTLPITSIKIGRAHV